MRATGRSFAKRKRLPAKVPVSALRMTASSTWRAAGRLTLFWFRLWIGGGGVSRISYLPWRNSKLSEWLLLCRDTHRYDHAHGSNAGPLSGGSSRV